MNLERGAVVTLDAPKIGFLRKAAEGLPAVCVQPSYLSARLSTVIVVPLIEPTPAELDHPLYVRVDPPEAGLGRAYVAVCPLVRGVPATSLRPDVRGRLSDVTLGRIARTLRLLQGL